MKVNVIFIRIQSSKTKGHNTSAYINNSSKTDSIFRLGLLMMVITQKVEKISEKDDIRETFRMKMGWLRLHIDTPNEYSIINSLSSLWKKI